MIQIRGKIPIIIHPTFWLMAAFIGYWFSGTFPGTLIWMGVIFISVLIHELGHASTALAFGLKPRIELVALGGLTYHNSEGLGFAKQFLIVLNGPLFGFLLYVAAWLLLKFVPALNGGISGEILLIFTNINLIWTVLNLIPVLPLDGGQLMRVLCEATFGIKGIKYALLCSMAVAGLISLGFFLFSQILVGALFFLMGFQSYDTWRRMRHITERDRDHTFKEALEKAENDLQIGHKDEAMAAFEKIRKDTKEGMIYDLATQYLAFLKYELGLTRETLDLLLPIRDDLSNDALCLLHRVAFDERLYPLVAELAGSCYQTQPSAETALRNASACAALAQSEASIGWLQTALQDGATNIEEIIKDNSFDPIRKDKAFLDYIQQHRGL